jgi:hypothetical protein
MITCAGCGAPLDIRRLTAEQVDGAWADIQHRLAARAADPALYSLLLRRTDEALAGGCLSEAQAGQVRRELDELHPALVLSQYWRELIPADLLSRPALGHYQRAFPRKELDIGEAYRQDPRRLVGFMTELARFTGDEGRILQATADFAERVGVPDAAAEAAMVEGLTQLRTAWRNKDREHAG